MVSSNLILVWIAINIGHGQCLIYYKTIEKSKPHKGQYVREANNKTSSKMLRISYNWHLSIFGQTIRSNIIRDVHYWGRNHHMTITR